jgi:hypothetical protein
MLKIGCAGWFARSRMELQKRRGQRQQRKDIENFHHRVLALAFYRQHDQGYNVLNWLLDFSAFEEHSAKPGVE